MNDQLGSSDTDSFLESPSVVRSQVRCFESELIVGGLASSCNLVNTKTDYVDNDSFYGKDRVR